MLDEFVWWRQQLRLLLWRYLWSQWLWRWLFWTVTPKMTWLRRWTRSSWLSVYDADCSWYDADCDGYCDACCDADCDANYDAKRENIKFKPLVYVCTFTNTPFVFHIVTQRRHRHRRRRQRRSEPFRPFCIRWTNSIMIGQAEAEWRIDNEKNWQAAISRTWRKEFFWRKNVSFFWRKRDKKVKVSVTLMC